MRTGLMWFDDTPERSINEKVERAALRFHEKYGLWPNIVYTNPRTEGCIEQSGVVLFHTKNPKVLGSAQLKQARSVQPNHFWLGLQAE